MKVVIKKPCGGICPDTRRPYAFSASDTPRNVGDGVGKDLIKAGYARRVPVGKKTKTSEGV